MIGGSPFLAPLHSLEGASKVADIGCGTGVATIQLASVFPAAQVYGVDISAVPQSAQEMAPANVSWVVGNILDVTRTEAEPKERERPGQDILDTEAFKPGGLDYAFGRMLFLGINDWPRYFTVAMQSLRSGGIIEHQDLDWKFYRTATSECLSDEWEWHQAILAAAEKSGLSTTAGSGAAAIMKQVGLEVLSAKTFEFSFVPSPKTPRSQAMGRYVQAKLLPQYPELLRKMLGAQGVDPGKLERLTKQCLRDISSEPGIHQKYTITIAKKP